MTTKSPSPEAARGELIEQAARRVLARVAEGRIDLRAVADTMGEKWDQDFPRALLEAALTPPVGNAAPGEPVEVVHPTMPHAINELTDCVCNIIQGLKNVRDGFTPVEKAIKQAEANYDYALEVARQAIKIASPAPQQATIEARNAVIEECAKVCDDEADIRFRRSDLAAHGDQSWGIDFEQASLAQGHKALTARTLAAAIRAKEAVEALRPFGEYLDTDEFDLDYKGSPLPDEQGMGWVYLTVGDFRRARALIQSLGEKL